MAPVDDDANTNYTDHKQKNWAREKHLEGLNKGDGYAQDPISFESSV